jgi:hypothetical protein
MARATVIAREAGVPITTCFRHVKETGALDAIQIALRAQCHAAYEGQETPEQAQQRAIRICREAQAQVEEDLSRRHR